MWKKTKENPDSLTPAEFLIFYLQDGNVCGQTVDVVLKRFPAFLNKWKKLLNSCKLCKSDIKRLSGHIPRKLRNILLKEYLEWSKTYISYKKYKFSETIIVDMRIRYIVHKGRVYPVFPDTLEGEVSYGYTDL
jgi:hypothetical protein